jgi:hypothetical protein
MSEQSDIAELSKENRKVYDASRKSGASHRFALMCALQQAPASRTDSDYFRKHPSLAKQFEGRAGQADLTYRLKQAKAHGYTPNPNSYYDASLADFAGDPKAWIGPSEGRGKVEAVMEARKVKAAKRAEQKAKEPTGRKRLAPDIVAQCAEVAIAKNPDLARKSKREITDMMVEQHGRKY